MGFFPFSLRLSRRARNVAGTLSTLFSPVRYSAGALVVADVDWYFTGNMALGAYTLLHTAPDAGARNVTLARTTVDTIDTAGTIVIVGTDLAGAAITETLTPGASGVQVVGTKAFKTITSITGVGWVISGGADTIVIGFGDRIGLPDKLSEASQVLHLGLAGVKEVPAAVTVSATVLDLNTVDFTSAHNGAAATVYYFA